MAVTTMIATQALFSENQDLMVISNDLFAENLSTKWTELSTNKHTWGLFSQAADESVKASAMSVAVNQDVVTGKITAAQALELRNSSTHLAALLVQYGEFSLEYLAAVEKHKELENSINKQKDQINVDSALMAAAQVLGAIASLGPKFKVFAIAQALINTFLGMTAALKNGFPMGLIGAAAIGIAGFASVAKIRAQKAQFGTPNLDFQNFGGETALALHGNEAIIPQGSGHGLAAEIAGALGNPTQLAASGVPGADGGGSGGEMINNITIVLDGKIVKQYIEKTTKQGSLRIHPSAVRDF